MPQTLIRRAFEVLLVQKKVVVDYPISSWTLKVFHISLGPLLLVQINPKNLFNVFDYFIIVLKVVEILTHMAAVYFQRESMISKEEGENRNLCHS
jgi:hypothetical protein